jgi:putative transcriptional regulator
MKLRKKGDDDMESLFEDLKQGLEEAIDYEKAQGKARVKTYTIFPVREYSNTEIRDIRLKAGMTQSVFASYMGVSKKTVEAWEGGRTHPTGTAYRLLDILASDDLEITDYVVEKSL